MTDTDPGVRRPVGDGRVLLEFESVPSTMDIGRLALLSGDRSIVGIRASHQSRGRGRRGAPWIAPPNTCLLVTYLLRSESLPDPAKLAFAGGVAVAEAIEAVTGLNPGLKWPNDVLLGNRKTAGVLAEAHGRDALIGIGLNVNVASFPPELIDIATSLQMESSRRWPLEEIETAVRTRLFELQSSPWESVLERWRRFDVTAGRRYTAVLDGAEVEATAVGVSEFGELLVQTTDGEVQPVVSATSSML